MPADRNPRRSGTSGRPSRSQAPRRREDERPRRPAAPGKPRRLEPPDDTDPNLLDPSVRAELRALPTGLAERVAKHLVAAGQLLDEHPDLAYQHATAARDLASRVVATREAAGVAAYRVGKFAEALTDLRAARRMTGSPEHLPLVADCERALGRPEKAIEVGSSPDAKKLPPEIAAELAIVVAGARRDLGQFDAALLTLQKAGADKDRVDPWTPRVWYAYADTLLAAGRGDEAREWFVATAAIDEDEETDAAERLQELTD